MTQTFLSQKLVAEVAEKLFKIEHLGDQIL